MCFIIYSVLFLKTLVINASLLIYPTLLRDCVSLELTILASPHESSLPGNNQFPSSLVFPECFIVLSLSLLNLLSFFCNRRLALVVLTAAASTNPIRLYDIEFCFFSEPHLFKNRLFGSHRLLVLTGYKIAIDSLIVVVICYLFG